MEAQEVTAMTIKDMETITGMSRANIRYYESEKLIHPARQENGYRVYSEVDGEMLLKIRLLRTLGLSLDDIRALQAGEASLPDTLTAHREVIAREQARLAKNEAVAQRLIAAGEAFDALDPRFYLAALENGEAVLKSDVSKKRNLPWRRYWARDFDYSLYSTLICTFLFRGQLNSFLSWLLPLIAMVLLEPLWLHLFATTPGKAIFCIGVTDLDGKKLSYGDALERTWLALLEGTALRVPFLNLYFLYKCYTKAQTEEPLPWEGDSDLAILDDAAWRYGLMFGLVLILGSLEILYLT